MEILNLREDGSGGYIVNGYINVPATDKDVIAWVEAKKEVMPAYTQGELDEVTADDKWAAIAEFWRDLTVTINGNKYKADEAGSNRMALKRDALAADTTTTWYENWGSFSTNKVDLQDAIAQADAELQAFIDATMAGA